MLLALVSPFFVPVRLLICLIAATVPGIASSSRTQLSSFTAVDLCDALCPNKVAKMIYWVFWKISSPNGGLKLNGRSFKTLTSPAARLVKLKTESAASIHLTPASISSASYLNLAFHQTGLAHEVPIAWQFCVLFPR